MPIGDRRMVIWDTEMPIGDIPTGAASLSFVRCRSRKAGEAKSLLLTLTRLALCGNSVGHWVSRTPNADRAGLMVEFKAVRPVNLVTVSKWAHVQEEHPRERFDPPYRC